MCSLHSVGGIEALDDLGLGRGIAGEGSGGLVIHLRHLKALPASESLEKGNSSFNEVQ